MSTSLPTFVDFFAGSGLVTQGAKHACTPVWSSNDICSKKAAIYTANHGPGHFHLGYDGSSFGSKEKEALANLNEALELYLEDLPVSATIPHITDITDITVGELAIA
jgi:site-specific DNA-cytosine methylase